MKKKRKQKKLQKKGSFKRTASSGTLSHSSVGVTPLGDRVLVEPLNLSEKMSPGGIIIPETIDKERPDQGRVVAVGPGKRNDEGKLVAISVKVGQKVMFSKYGPDEIKIGGKEYYVISESNILAVIN